MRTRPPTALALAALTVAGGLFLGACSDDGEYGAGGQSSSTTAPASTDTTSAGDIPDEPGLADEGIGDLDELALSLLIQEGELVDPPLVDAGYTPGAVSAVCGGSVDADHPPDVLVGVTLEDAGTTVVEELRVYADDASATSVFDAMVVAGGCGEAATVTDDVPSDRAVRFDPGGGAVHVLAQIADTVLAFRVTGDALDPVEVAAFGAGKVAAALEN